MTRSVRCQASISIHPEIKGIKCIMRKLKTPVLSQTEVP